MPTRRWGALVKKPFFSEQLTFKEGLQYGHTINHNKSIFRGEIMLVTGPRHQFFSSAGAGRWYFELA